MLDASKPRAPEKLTFERGYTAKDFTALRAYVQRIAPAVIDVVGAAVRAACELAASWIDDDDVKAWKIATSRFLRCLIVSQLPTLEKHAMTVKPFAQTRRDLRWGPVASDSLPRNGSASSTWVGNRPV
ncbi:hypothetical protein P9250_30795 [Caballeronia sp. LP006]|uniref:hypothetical protein n=1 Tax=Caballeronia sp. LP006 TaxID=3038552 RepID=UPI0028647631|nr:hypothetical protein [Caballeronia sp. LP006]MDR5832256.1 hypothetical protein [Caballeronia sp. LP006]